MPVCTFVLFLSVVWHVLTQSWCDHDHDEWHPRIAWLKSQRKETSSSSHSHPHVSCWLVCSGLHAHYTDDSTFLPKFPLDMYCGCWYVVLAQQLSHCWCRPMAVGLDTDLNDTCSLGRAGNVASLDDMIWQSMESDRTVDWLQERDYANNR